MQHPDPNVERAIVELANALRAWGRNSGRESILIVREEDGFICRAYIAPSWNPDVPDDITDEQMLQKIKMGWALKSLPQDKRRVIAGITEP